MTKKMVENMEEISIHAPARGATVWGQVILRRYLFQSTLPRGERREKTMRTNDEIIISIHAPARGATFGWSIRH